MRTGRKLSKSFMLTLFLALAAMALVACGAEETDETVEPLPGEGLEETPILEETPFLEETPLVDETPLVEDTPMVEETPLVEDTPMVEETATLEATATLAATATMEDAETPEATPADGETGAETGAETQVVRSDVLLGMMVVTQDDEQVGTVRDALVDMQGNLQFVLLDLQLDEARTVAANWNQLELRESPNITDTMGADDTTDTDLQGTPEATIEGTPGAADDGTDTGLTNQAFAENWVLVYTGQRTELESAQDIDRNVLDQEGALIDLQDLQLEQEQTAEAQDGQALQLSEFDYNLVNDQGEDVGEVEEVIVDLSEGAVLYAVVDVGGFLGIGEKSVAVPWQQLQFDETEENFVVNLTEETLTEAPAVNFDDWTDGVAPDPNWHTETENFWQDVTAAAP